jgi:hypothetical protein
VVPVPKAASRRTQRVVRLSRSDPREAHLVTRLPKRGSPYSLNDLSEAETAALELALSDGFGEHVGVIFGDRVTISASGRGALNFERVPLPKDIDPGLLHHSFIVRKSEDDSEGFWKSSSDKAAPFQEFPLGFIVRRLRIYFRHQFARFCRHMRGYPEYAAFRLAELEELASRELYTKPWYEYHALQLLDGLRTSNGIAVAPW